MLINGIFPIVASIYLVKPYLQGIDDYEQVSKNQSISVEEEESK